MNENINKIIYGTSTLIDLTEDTVHPDRMYKGDIAHAADGSIITGTAEITVDNTTLIMPEGLCELLGTVDPETHHWIRPDFLPDLDSIYNGELNTVYMTVDATGRISDPHVYIRLWAACTVQVGHIENNSFVVESTDSVSNGGYWLKQWTPTPNFYPIIKISGVSELRGIGFTAWTNSEGRAYQNRYQAVIEWIGHMNYADSSTIVGYFIEREKIKVTNTANNFLTYRWANGYSLQEIDTTDWNTSNWKINDLYQTWYCCFNLQYLNVNHWDTSQWTVAANNNMSYTWNNCSSLKELDLSSWNTSNWKITNMTSTWANCSSLQKLDVSTWDTSNWKVTNMDNTWLRCSKLEELYLPWDTSGWVMSGTVLRYTWQNCCTLRSLNVSSWNTSAWHITNIGATWNGCTNLKLLDLNNWDTSNWEVTSIDSTWRYCYALQELDIDTWDTSNWAVINMSATWGQCTNLKFLDLSNWNTSNWAVTSMSQTWYGCQNLEYLDVSTWDTSNWAVTSLENTWNQNRKLLNLPIGNWDTSNWKVTSMSYTWDTCLVLENLPIDNWDVSGWKVTTMYSTFAWMLALKELDLSNWDTSDWDVFSSSKNITWPRSNFSLVSLNLSGLNFSNFFAFRQSSTYANDSCFKLQNIIYGSNNNNKMISDGQASIRYDWCYLLTHESLLNILNTIGTVSTAKTLQLGSVNLNKLTAEEKAIATNKGWTLT